MKHTKHELMLYSFYDFTGLASHLETMAAKGWLAEKIGVLGIRYRRIQPQTLRFSVTYFPDASEFDAAPTGGQEVFRDYCAQAGWEFAFQSPLKPIPPSRWKPFTAPCAATSCPARSSCSF